MALVTVARMDPLTWMLGAAALGAYGYRRPIEVFRLALYARLHAGGLRRHRRTLPDATVRFWRGGRGAPLVFVHGFGTEAAINWYAQLLPFSGAYDVLAPDLPGFGASERCQDTNCIALQVRCLRTLLDDLGIQRVSLVGHSMGGWISLAFAAAHPERVERLVVVDAAGLRFEPDLNLERALLPDTIDDVRMLIRANFLGSPRLPGFVLRDVLRVAKRDAVGRTELLRRLVYGTEHVDERLDAIRARTLVVWGAEDPLTPLALGERIAASVDGARLVVFPDCAHSPNVERPERFNDLLRGFLREQHVVAGGAEVAAAVG
jgi:pimeloyl-ACP methyl ester carboxylesterase